MKRPNVNITNLYIVIVTVLGFAYFFIVALVMLLGKKTGNFTEVAVITMAVVTMMKDASGYITGSSKSSASKDKTIDAALNNKKSDNS